MATQLFTVVLDYGGGTYVAQVHAASALGALRAWLSIAADLGIPSFGLEHARRLAEDDIFLDPMLLSGLTNAWCTSASLDGVLALFNIVATSEAAVLLGEETAGTPA